MHIPFPTHRLPLPQWLLHYERRYLGSDLMAGLVVAIVLVPQSIAYALLAGLPPQMGLYASIVPPLVYGLLGSSRVLSVGPVAIDSLLVLAGVSQLASPGSSSYIALVGMLALLVGGLQIGLGMLRAGFLVNFFSRPVLSGFLNAAALLIISSQLKVLLGLPVPRGSHPVLYPLQHWRGWDLPTLALGLGSIGVLVALRQTPALRRAAPLLVIMAGMALVWGLHLETVSVVGRVPQGLPQLHLPQVPLERVPQLLPTALTLAAVGFMESTTIAKSLASQRRQKVDADRELVALGAANIGAGLTGGFSVTGGLSRSMVNFSAGAQTGLASIITALILLLTVLLLTPLFYHLPHTVLAAIIVVAVFRLLDASVLQQAWRYDRSDAASWGISFFGVLLLGVEYGLLLGVGSALALHLWRSSRPHIAIIGRVGHSEHFRNVRRHQVQTCPQVLTVRVDESLYFANMQYLENWLLNAVAEQPAVQHVVLVCSAVNAIDASAVVALDSLRLELQNANVLLHLAEVKGPVADKLRRVGFLERLGAAQLHLSTHEAMHHLDCC